jgi:signal transduction histidine kinase
MPLTATKAYHAYVPSIPEEITLSQQEDRIRKMIAVLNAMAEGRFEPLMAEGLNDDLGSLERAVEFLQSCVQTSTAASGSTITNLLADQTRLFLWNTALQNIDAADSILYHGGNLEDFYLHVVREAREMVRARYGMLAIFDETGKPIKFITDEEIAKMAHFPEGKGLFGALYHEHATTKVDDIAADSRSCGFPPNHPPMQTLLGAPLLIGGKVKGVLYMANKEYCEFFGDDTGHLADHFSENDRDMLGLFSDYLARSLERIDLMAALQDKNILLETLVNKLNEAQGQLLQSEKMASIGQLAAGVAHEINNPIGYINSNLGTLEKYIKNLFSIVEAFELAETQLDIRSDSHIKLQALKKQLDIGFLREDIFTLMNESKEGVERVKNIVQNLKDFSHVDESAWQWADLLKGLDSTLNVVWNELKYKAEVIKEYGELPQVECLPFQLNQVFMNMLVNAAQAIDTRGTITIRTGTFQNEVWVEFSDTGHGIQPENLDRIFEPFFTTKAVGKGTGLGLSLSYSIVRKHHGRIHVASEVGKGTTFRILLPIRQVEKIPSGQ